jgi:hypothetical protein
MSWHTRYPCVRSEQRDKEGGSAVGPRPDTVTKRQAPTKCTGRNEQSFITPRQMGESRYAAIKCS